MKMSLVTTLWRIILRSYYRLLTLVFGEEETRTVLLSEPIIFKTAHGDFLVAAAKRVRGRPRSIVSPFVRHGYQALRTPDTDGGAIIEYLGGWIPGDNETIARAELNWVVNAMLPYLKKKKS